MDCKHICMQAQKLVNQYIQNHGHNNDLMLVLQIKEVVDGNMDYTKKLTFIES